MISNRCNSWPETATQVAEQASPQTLTRVAGFVSTPPVPVTAGHCKKAQEAVEGLCKDQGESREPHLSNSIQY